MKLLTNVHFKIRFGNNVEWNSHFPIGSVFKKYVVALNAQQATSEITLTLNWLAGLHLGVTPGETLVIGPFVESAFQPWGRNFQSVGRMNKVFDVQNRSQM